MPACSRAAAVGERYPRDMAVSASQINHSLGRHAGRATLEQGFRFDGPGADTAAICDILRRAPLVGSNSIFGDRPGDEAPTTNGTRNLRGFSPAPGFRFDVELAERSPGVFRVRFSQPDRRVPYLEGDLLWTVSAVGDSVVLGEEINTSSVLAAELQPLEGARPSLRRWLFFRAGHKQVMLGAAKNIARLVPAPGS